VADDSVDLIVTSPPYFALRSYQDDGDHYDGQIGSEATPGEFLDALWAVTAECVRVLKPSGSLWVNLGDKYSGVNPGSYRRHTQSYVGDHSAVAASEAEADHRPDWGTVRTKSLMGLPWRYAIGCIDDLGLILRAEVVWSKPNGLPESVTDRVRRSHEQWFHFTLEPRYFSALDEIREPYAPASIGKSPGANAMKGRAQMPDRMDEAGYTPGWDTNPLGKLPGSVWSIPSEPLKVPDDLGVDHFAAFPQEWPRRLILGWCPAEVCTACGQGRAPVVERENLGTVGAHNHDRAAGMTHGLGASTLRNTQPTTITGYGCACPDNSAPSTPGVVLDPFAGTGTTVMVARALGRTGIGVDLSSDYLRLASWRVFESGHASKTVARTNGERQGLLL
jgi:DNA modification methylase